MNYQLVIQLMLTLARKHTDVSHKEKALRKIVIVDFYQVIIRQEIEEDYKMLFWEMTTT